MLLFGISAFRLQVKPKINQNWLASYFMICSLFICLTLTSSHSSKSTSGNHSVVYSPDRHQTIRTILVRRNGNNGSNGQNNGQNNNNSNNSTKLETQKEISLESGRVDSDHREWSLQFDPSYFASLNAANHRPIDLMSASPSQTKVSSSSESPDNIYYYSPETYGKTTHKNHKTGSYTYSYPSTTTTSSTTSTTPTPKTSKNRYGEYSTGTTSKGYSEPAPQSFSAPYDPSPYDASPYNRASHNPNQSKNEKHSAINLNYDEASTEEELEEPNYYDGSEEMGRKYYYPIREANKHYSQHDYYGTDLSSLPTSNDNSKQSIPSGMSSPVTDYGPHEETHEYDSNFDSSYGTSNVKFPSKYYGGGTGAYYPSYYPSPYYPPTSGHSGYPGGDSLTSSKSSWLGPGIAGLLLGILPLGILVASMVPAFMTVPIVSTATVGRRRRRQIQETDLFNLNNTKLFLNPGVLNIISRYGMSPLEDSKCLQEMFCKFTTEGRNKNTNLFQSLLYIIAEWTPVEWAKSVGLDILLNAIKKDKCETTFECMKRKQSSYINL